MSIEAVIVGLLHFSAIVAVLAIAYVGLDEPDPHEDRRGERRKVAQAAADQVILQLGLTDGVSIELLNGDEEWTVGTIFPAGVICLIAERPIKLGPVLGRLHVCYRQRHIPLFDFVAKNSDLKYVYTVALISIAIFLHAVACLIWRNDSAFIFAGGLYPKIAYAVLTISLVAILVFAYAARAAEPQRLAGLCKRLHEKINKKFAKLRNALSGSLNKVDKATENMRLRLNKLESRDKGKKL